VAIIEARNMSLPQRAGFSELIARIRTAVHLWREYWDVFNELDALTDRDLADIGIVRADIPAIARAHVQGNPL